MPYPRENSAMVGTVEETALESVSTDTAIIKDPQSSDASGDQSGDGGHMVCSKVICSAML